MEYYENNIDKTYFNEFISKQILSDAKVLEVNICIVLILFLFYFHFKLSRDYSQKSSIPVHSSFPSFINFLNYFQTLLLCLLPSSIVVRDQTVLSGAAKHSILIKVLNVLY